MRPGSRRWPWYDQVLDATFAAAGLAVLATMAVRNSYPIPGVLVVFVCGGRVTASSVLRYLIGRWEPPGGSSS